MMKKNKIKLASIMDRLVNSKRENEVKLCR